jgi:ATP-dependent helicase/nuclease subunit A
VMTVHGAKGLEAPIVFLPDTCTTAAGGPVSTLLDLSALALPEGVASKPFVWGVKGTASHAAMIAARAERNRLEAEERHRLLYVAMTRARDRLYVAGFEGKMGRARGCWYDLIAEALRPTFVEVEGPGGGKVLRHVQEQTVAARPKHEAAADGAAAETLPAWALRGAPREPSLSIPLAPSRLEAYAPDADGEPLVEAARPRAGDEPASLRPPAIGEENRFLRGTLTHALLQHLPELPAASWPQAAQKFIDQRGGALSDRARKDIVKETLAILRAREFAPLFGPQSRAEVPIVALLPNPKPKGVPLKLLGQIDRLVDLGTEVLIVDYKTNRPPPREVERVAPAYLYQLAAYRLALGEIYPGRVLRAALLWTETPRIMQVPGELLDQYATRLWDLDLGQLDASEGHS